MCDRSGIHTLNCYGYAVRVRPWHIERSYPTDLAEGVLCSVCAECVGSEELFGLAHQLETCRWDNKVDVASHGTVRAVTPPRNDAWLCLNLPPHVPTMASSIVDYCVGIHYSEDLGRRRTS
eukprot:TRINITY_DN3448_c0_g1_i1.p2 TRINITY_DN3448_c0_g1~~TRINITY_DN3448_c0_g1_i1.p2  ORF type:complete len:121 (+),score=2.26 TRINITY_DN3448_c0_g1_i1:319-681(+)